MKSSYDYLRRTKHLTDSIRRTGCLILLIGTTFVLFTVSGLSSGPRVESRAAVDSRGTVHVPALAIPLSSYMSAEAKQAFILQQRKDARARAQWADVKNMSVDQQLQMMDNYFLPWVERAKAVYPVKIEEEKIADVQTEVIEPKHGVSARNRNRVLISLHGGGYEYSSGGLHSMIDAIPVAGYGEIKVVSVDYQLAPKYKWPAAIENVTGVYRALLSQYKPENIGLYGCSTGATLTANLIAWWQKEKLPRPGAIGLFCDGAVKDDVVDGDSYYFASAIDGWRIPAPGESYAPEPYMEGTDGRDPLVAPVVSLDVLSKFPPTLLISGSRDALLSNVLYTHSRLVKAGVEADLHVWDGMWHGFYYDVDLPESKEAYEVMIHFFDKHLGQTPK